MTQCFPLKTHLAVICFFHQNSIRLKIVSCATNLPKSTHYYAVTEENNLVNIYMPAHNGPDLKTATSYKLMNVKLTNNVAPNDIDIDVNGQENTVVSDWNV